MNATARGKKLKGLLLIGCLLGTAQFGQAVNYTNTDLLLVFRENNFNDVEFDLGPVSAYLGLASGTQKTISFDSSLVNSNFNNTLNGVTFSLVAATGLDSVQPRAWLTDVYASPIPTDVTLSKFSQIQPPATLVGTFTLDAAGVLTFNAGGGPVLTAPTIKGIVRNGNTAVVSFTTVTGFKYQLRYATSLPDQDLSPGGRTITGSTAFRAITIDRAGTLFDSGFNAVTNDATTGLITYRGTMAGKVPSLGIIATNATQITYQGVPFSHANVTQGSYTLWGYEHLVNRTGALSANQQAVRDALIAAITDPTFQGTNPLYTGSFTRVSDMQVERGADGGTITSLTF